MIRLDLKEFSEDGLFSESSFIERLRQFDWEPYCGKAVLVGVCGLKAVPGWVYLAIGAHLGNIARSIRFGNEHSNIAVYNKSVSAPDKTQDNLIV